MNKKALWLILAFLTFFGIKSEAFASVTYDLVEKKIYLSINAKNVTSAEFSCEDGYSKKISNDNASKFEDTIDLNELSNGAHYCKLTYDYDKNGSTKTKTDTKRTLIYVREPLNDKNGTCVLIIDASGTGGDTYEDGCKKSGCKFTGKNCEAYNLNNSNSSGTSSSSGTSGGASSGSSSSTGNSNSTNLDRNDSEPFDASTFCYDIKAGLRIVGITILMIKIIVPFAIILMGSFDFYKTVSSGKNEDLKKDAIMVGKRVLTGLIIFFLPTIIKTTVNILDDDMDADYHYCINCLFDPLNTCDD